MRKVIIGLGTQRAGTTFLANLLNQISSCKPPAIKELNIWSPLRVKYLFDYYKFNEKNKELTNNQSLNLIKNTLEIRQLRYVLQSNVEDYFSYFEYLFKKLITNNIDLICKMERAKGFEPSTSTLARLRSTPELRPLIFDSIGN